MKRRERDSENVGRRRMTSTEMITKSGCEMWLRDMARWERHIEDGRSRDRYDREPDCSSFRQRSSEEEESDYGIIAKLRHYIPSHTTINIYRSFILPHLTYGVVA